MGRLSTSRSSICALLVDNPAGWLMVVVMINRYNMLQPCFMDLNG
jgi:hypothetical protein